MNVQRKTITVATAHALLEKARENGLIGMSKVNPQFTKQQAYDIFAGMLRDMPDDTKLNHLAAKNLVREFGQ